MANHGQRLLVISYHFPPDGSVGGLRWAGLTKNLARLGWKIAVLTAAAQVGSDAAPGAQVEWCPRLRTLIDYYQSLRRLDQGSPRAFPTTLGVARSATRPGLLRQLRRELAAFMAFPDESRGWVLRAALRARSLVRRFQPHVVVSSGPPHSAHLVARMATIGTSARWFIDLRDPWAGPITKAWESHPIAGTRMFHVFFPLLERQAVRAAHGVITNALPLAHALAARYPDVAVVCIPNGVDPESLPTRAADPYPGLSIAYAGTLYGSRDLGPVVRALRIFLGRHQTAAQAGSKLRVAGHSEPRFALALEAQVASLGLEPYVEVLGPLPRPQALNIASRSRLVLVLAQEQELQIPAKLYESVALGIPTLVVAETRSAAAVEGNRLGALVRDPGDVEGIACVLERLWLDDARRAQCPAEITYAAIAPLVDSLFREGPSARLAASTALQGLTQDVAVPVS